MEDTVTEKIPDMEAAEWLAELSKSADAAVRADLQTKLMARIREKSMGALYAFACKECGWTADAALVGQLAAANEAKFAEFQAKIADAEENLGESEVFDAHLARANYACLVSGKERAVELLEQAFKKTVGIGGRIDIVLTIVRLGFFWLDHALVRSSVARAHLLIDSGGDWDRRNRLKVYEGLLFLTNREFKRAADKLIDTVATFTSYELFSYRKLVQYVLTTSLVSFDRPRLKKSVVHSPEILSVIESIPHIGTLLSGFYECDYRAAMRALCDFTDYLRVDRFIAHHAAYFCREMRIKLYAQYLASYRIVSMQNMGQAFGVGLDFLDRELSRFIAAGRIHCKIDKVNGVIETTRVDTRNTQFSEVLKEGDVLLHRLQKMSRVIHM